MRVLVLCTGNSCRSQMAEGWLRTFGGQKAEIYSAGIEAHGLNPIAVQVMNEAGVDISHHTSKTIDAVEHLDFDIVITVCDSARERCPYFPARVKQVHHDFTDPAKATGTHDEVLTIFRSVRDQIRDYCQDLVASYLR